MKNVDRRKRFFVMAVVAFASILFVALVAGKVLSGGGEDDVAAGPQFMPGASAPAAGAPPAGANPSGPSAPAASATPAKKKTKSSPGLTTQPVDAVDGREAGVYYRTCAEAKLAKATPLRKGTEGYRTELDPDGDGIACA
ncbi:excalibur calcium-binding domain-containing protein [Actinoplanes sp. NPDC051861]|uniref:excalibur calcium-binding domain-containing protein n=1 Tax=Actinoplanes sp. NPDC051861 TaxID=3155170 RepID=UPI0034434AFB